MTAEDGDHWPMLADEVAALLIALHSTQSSDFSDVRQWDPREMLSGLDEALSKARRRCPDGIGFDARWEECRTWVSAEHSEVLCHGDPWFGNMLVDPATGRLTGVVDFESAVVADPAFDLASVLHMPREFGERCRAEYSRSSSLDPDLGTRVEAHRFLREITALDYAMKNALPQETADIVENIRALLGPFSSRVER
jgi:aminoglycoside phosphotransferase (APT) family kinase protein